MQKKLAVIFPGIGYHKDKPLLYFAGKLACSLGYEIISIDYHNMPQKIRGNAEMLQKSSELAYRQAEEQLSSVAWNEFDSVLLIGKSIGTIAAAKYAETNKIAAKQVWYTPLNATFSAAHSPAGPCIAFLGEADPWSDIESMKRDAAEKRIPLHLYPDCNHSLECSDVLHNITTLHEVMQITADFLHT